ncbi:MULTISPECIES: alpha/beta hydrolase [unclassified Streptomyces]|uniref:alpha/beta hydrolase n=1 Tax=unclassified Streptomyces TaxID=2593676 RepID=UPI00081DB5E8|nr:MULTISPECIES: alpha/beta hydrolase [unclassified Streptomyces]SCE27957.1 alpha/beta hydrolase fold [Streptomyces sp. ScaeMP-e83]
MNRATLATATALALLGALSLTACTGGAVPDRGTAKAPDPASRPDLKPFYGQRLQWADCATDGYECARLTVPLDYAHPGNGRTFVLPVARTAATGPAKRIGSLVYNPGGPGAGGVSSLQEGMDESFGAAVRARFDIVSFDLRGVAGSVPALTCEPADAEAEDETEEDPAEEEASDGVAPLYPRTEADRSAAASGARTAAEDCQKHSGPILRHVGTEDAARDLDVLRAALGERELTYLGWSYGTSLGTSYAEQFPRRVRAMVLDGAIDPSLDWRQRVISQSAGFRRSVDDYAERCAEIAGESCPGRSPEEIRALLERLYQRAEREPLPVAEDSTYAEYGGMDATAVLDAVSMAMYTPEDQWGPLSEALREADQGDATKLGALDDEEAEEETEDPGTAEEEQEDDTPEPPADNSDAALTAVNCLDIPHPRSLRPYWDALAPADKAAGVYGTAGVTAELTCRDWPSGGRRPHRVDADGVPPVLVVGTTGDPSTPYEESVSLAEQFPKGMLLTYEGLGHTAYGRGDACVTAKVDAYLVKLERVRPGATC